MSEVQKGVEQKFNPEDTGGLITAIGEMTGMDDD